MPNKIQDIIEVVTDTENGLIFEKNISVPLRNSDLPIRANIYRPLDTSRKYAALVTYGPYGKDIPYEKYIARLYHNPSSG